MSRKEVRWTVEQPRGSRQVYFPGGGWVRAQLGQGPHEITRSVESHRHPFVVPKKTLQCEPRLSQGLGIRALVPVFEIDFAKDPGGARRKRDP